MNKPNGTSAASTAFCKAKVEGPGGFLWIDGNGKITAGNGTLEDPKPNAFSLVQIKDCPGATESCKAACYVHSLQKHAPDTHALYEHNSREIRRILASDVREVLGWVNIFADWITANCNGGFRWHVSGDVFSASYANFISAVCDRSPSVRHWIYTRSFQFLDQLRANNLTVNLSADRNNYTAAFSIAVNHGCRICYMTDDGHVPSTLVDGDIIFPDYSLRGGTEAGQKWFNGLSPQQKSFVCPVDYHGKAENRRCGPCDRCTR